MKFVHMNIGKQISWMCNESDCVNRYWNLVYLTVEAMCSVISTQNYNIAASLISLLSKVNFNSKRVLGTKWLCKEQSTSLIKQRINENKGNELRKEKAFRSYFFSCHFLSFAYFSLKLIKFSVRRKWFWNIWKWLLFFL